MSRALVIIKSTADRNLIARWAQNVEFGTRVEFKAAKRSLPQNARFYAMLTDISTQVLWHGMKLNVQDWKMIFLNALKRELRLVPNLEGNGFVNLGTSSSDLSKEEMTDAIELLFKFGAEHGVKFQDEAEAA